MPSILFVCRANQFRSPLAAACLLREIKSMDVGQSWLVESAGTWTKNNLTVPDFLLQVTYRLGIAGLARHRSRQLIEEILVKFDLIIVMEQGQKEAIAGEFPKKRQSIFLLSEVVEDLVYDIADPATLEVDPEQVADEISALIKKGALRITTLANDLCNGNFE